MKKKEVTAKITKLSKKKLAKLKGGAALISPNLSNWWNTISVAPTTKAATKLG